MPAAAALAALLGKATAKRVVTRAAASAATGGGSLADALTATPELDGHQDVGALRALLDPEDYLGAAGPLVDRALTHYRRPRPRS